MALNRLNVLILDMILPCDPTLCNRNTWDLFYTVMINVPFPRRKNTSLGMPLDTVEAGPSHWRRVE